MSELQANNAWQAGKTAPGKLPMRNCFHRWIALSIAAWLAVLFAAATLQKMIW